MIIEKETVIKIIDEVMNNREIDSIRNAILAIRDKVVDLEGINVVDLEGIEEGPIIPIIKLPLRGKNPLYCVEPYYEGATKVCIDVNGKLDTGIYGSLWYE